TLLLLFWRLLLYWSRIRSM
uniref:Uncharacterized protein n=1 Tax=Strongyloides stercoralis TaxID=6248 RepID=A0A0K0E571_STRER